VQDVAEPFVVVLYAEGMSGEQIKQECGMRDSVVRVSVYLSSCCCVLCLVTFSFSSWGFVGEVHPITQVSLVRRRAACVISVVRVSA
jgi:hypothetical protein